MPPLQRPQYFDLFHSIYQESDRFVSNSLGFSYPNHYFDTIAVLAISGPPRESWESGSFSKHEIVYFYKSILKPLNWPKLNPMRAVRYDEYHRLQESGFWRPTRARLKHRLWEVRTAAQEYLIDIGRE